MKILLVDDHKMFLDGLKRSLEQNNVIEEIFTAISGKEALRVISQNSDIDLAIVDVTMPDMNGSILTQKLKKCLPDLKVLALSMYSNVYIISDMLRSGATGYVLKDCETEELERAIQAVYYGAFYLCSTAGSLIIKNYLNLLENSEELREPKLTEREREILCLLAHGLKVHEIAQKLSISRHTVNTHRSNIMAKLNCDTFVDLIRYCIREGICKE